MYFGEAWTQPNTIKNYKLRPAFVIEDIEVFSGAIKNEVYVTI